MKYNRVMVFAALTVAAVGSVSGFSQVKESTVPCSCCGRPELKFNPHCENIWSINKIIAHFYKTIRDCTSPCQKIGYGLLTLERCVDVNVAISCVDSMNVTVDQVIHYQGQPCSAFSRMAPGNQGSIWLLLLAMVIAGWMSPLL